MTVDSLEWVAVPVQRGELYECARWIERAGVFQWVDILRCTIHRWRPGSGEVLTRLLETEFVTAALPLDAVRSIVTSRSSIHEYNWDDGTLTLLGQWEFAEQIRFNDGNIAPDGQIYIGTMSMARETSSACLSKYHDGKLTTIIPDVGISNGLAFTDAFRAYYVDSLVPRISLIDLSGSKPQVDTFVQFSEGDEPDGLAVTARGEVLVAMWGSRRLGRIRSDGTRLSDISVPATSPTSVAIGGEGGDVLLVTTAGGSDFPEDGLVYAAEVPWAK